MCLIKFVQDHVPDLGCVLELRGKLDFTTDMQTNASQSSKRKCNVRGVYGALTKKLLMVNTEKAKGRESFTTD